MTELSPRARELLDAARHADDPTDEARAQVRAALFAKLGLPPGPGGSGPSAAGSEGAGATAGQGLAGAGLAGKASSAVGVKALLAVLAVGAITGVVIVRGPAPDRQPAQAPRSEPLRSGPASVARPEASDPVIAEVTASPVAVAPDPGYEAAASSPVQPRPRRQAMAPTARGSVSPAAGDEDSAGEVLPARPETAGDLRSEHALLRRARTSLRKRDATDALQAVHEHARRYPDGALAQERDVLEILALCANERRDEARAKATSFAERFPGSPLAARLRDSCVH